MKNIYTLSRDTACSGRRLKGTSSSVWPRTAVPRLRGVDQPCRVCAGTAP